MTPAHTKKQAQSDFRRRVRVALAAQDISINKLARAINRPRTSVSKAINQDRFPRIQTQIARKLGL